MEPITITLMAAALVGGIMKAFGGKKKVIDPEWLKAQFGAAAVNQEMIDLFNNAISSPEGQRMMTNAAEQGAQFGQETQRAAAAAGLGAGGGAASGTGIFATSAGEGATNSFQRQGRADLFERGRSTAQDIVNNRMAAYMNSYTNAQNQPSTLEKVGDAVGGAAGTALSYGGAAGTASSYSTPTAKTEKPPTTDYVSSYTGSKLGMNKLVVPSSTVQLKPETASSNFSSGSFEDAVQQRFRVKPTSRFQPLSGLVRQR